MKTKFSDAEHKRHCKKAGCRHPAVYDFGTIKSQGWCKRCREIAFGSAK